MRISTLNVFEQSIASINRQQAQFMHVGQQLATGRRVVNPSDDPQAASRAVGVAQSKAVTEQYMDARVSARNALSQQESILNSVGDAITRAKTLLIQGANGTLSDADRASNASELKGVFENLLGQANSTDGNGRYLFGGYKEDSPPFIIEADGSVNYVGDANAREQLIQSDRLMPVSDNGITIFQRVHSGAGYLASAGETNSGNMTFVGPRVLDAADPDYGTPFNVTFDDDGAGNITYTISDADGPIAGAEDQPYTPGMILEMGGIAITLEGEPEDGDVLNIGRAADMEPDLFATLQRAIAALDKPAETPADQAALRNTLNTAMRELDNALDNVLTVRASAGARLNELDIVDSSSSTRLLNYEQTLSDLLDVNVVKAIAEYSLRQMGLEASQRVFVDIKGMSLGNFIR